MPSDKTPDLTRTGLALSAISVLAGLVAAVLIVTWRNAHGEQLPTKSAIILTLLVCVGVFAVGSGVARLFGFDVVKRQEGEPPESK
jgi:hypothetical protein